MGSGERAKGTMSCYTGGTVKSETAGKETQCFHMETEETPKAAEKGLLLFFFFFNFFY